MAASPSVAEELRAIGVERVRVVPLGVDLDVFNPTARDRTTLTALGIPVGRPVMVFAGRLCPEKGVGVLFAALEALVPDERSHLLLVGDDPSAASLRQWADRLGGVTFIPYVSDRARLARVLASCDLYAATGPGETFGLAVAEALACGLPVIGVDSGAVPDRVRGSEVARLYARGDASACAAAIREACARLSPALVGAARRHAERTCGWRDTFSALLDVYRDVAAERVS